MGIATVLPTVHHIPVNIPSARVFSFGGGGIIKPFLVRVSVFMAIIIKITAFEGYDYTLITNFMH